MKRVPAKRATATARQIAQALGVTPERVRQRARAESWPYKNVKVQGGMQKQFYILLLSPAVLSKVIASLGNREREQIGKVLAVLAQLPLETRLQLCERELAAIKALLAERQTARAPS